MNVETAEWHEATWKPTKWRKYYNAFGWMMVLFIFLSLIINYPYRIESLCVAGLTLILLNVFSQSLKPMEERIGQLLAESADRQSVPVSVSFWQKSNDTGHDAGALLFDEGVLIFRGLRTDFRVPSSNKIEVKKEPFPRGLVIQVDLSDRVFEIHLSTTASRPRQAQSKQRLDNLILQWSQGPEREGDLVLPLNIQYGEPASPWRRWRGFGINMGLLGIFIAGHLICPKQMLFPLIPTAMFWFPQSLVMTWFADDFKTKQQKEWRELFPDDPTVRRLSQNPKDMSIG